jgi:hypothetical protein
VAAAVVPETAPTRVLLNESRMPQADKGMVNATYLARVFHEKPEILCRSGFSRDYGGGFDTGRIRG